MRIAMSADHRGSAASKMLADKLRRDGHTVQIIGETTSTAVDYPEPAYLAVSYTHLTLPTNREV